MPRLPRPVRSRLPRAYRWIMLVPAALLLQTGVCVQTAQRVLINGAFNAVTPLANQWLADQLGLAGLSQPP